MNTAIVILLTVIAGSQLAATAALFTIAKAQQLRAKLQAENNRTMIGQLGEFKDTLDTVASPLIPSAPPRFPLELVEVIKEALLADHSGSAEDIADAIRRTYALSHRSERGKLFEKLDSIRDQIGILRTNDPLKVVFRNPRNFSPKLNAEKFVQFPHGRERSQNPDSRQARRPGSL